MEFVAIDVETAKVLTSDVLEIVSSLKKVQDAGKPTNEAFTEILDDFRNKLTEEMRNNTIKSQDIENIEER